MFSLLWNLAGSDTYPSNELGQACRTSMSNEGPGEQLGCYADATGNSWVKNAAKLEPKWENPQNSASGSTWGSGKAGVGYY
mmetsp:Transcript_7622/g.19064  ORF Transcript_7622/g.19064 Transcript_7622/m.19064 type:complete len:81 (+) Transcript_7622:35-277(+)